MHSVFSIPIDGSQPCINWALVKYDIIIIDEVGMVSIRNMRHILHSIHSLPIPPVYFFCGDPAQQQPLDTIDGNTQISTNLFHHVYLHCDLDVYTFYQQHRVKDSYLDGLLKIMRSSYLSNDQVRAINNRCPYSGEVCSENIISAFEHNSNTLFVTITRKGSRFINSVICDHLFQCDQVLSVVLDAELCEVNLFEGLNICLTENINKHHRLVNGMQGHIISFDRGIIFFRLIDGSTHFLHPLFDEPTGKSYFPFLLNYGITIFKIQGKNLKNITIWLDRKKPSPGAAYVAFSRVQYFKNILLLETVNRFQLCPIKHPSVEIGKESDI